MRYNQANQQNGAFVATAAGLGVGSAISAIYGYITADKCEDYISKQKQELSDNQSLVKTAEDNSALEVHKRDDNSMRTDNANGHKRWIGKRR